MTNETNLPPEWLEKAKAATSAAELLTLAQENGIPLTAEQAVAHYAKLHPESGAISDDELDNVSGGGCCFDEHGNPKCLLCGASLGDSYSGGENPDGSLYCRRCGWRKQKT